MVAPAWSGVTLAGTETNNGELMLRVHLVQIHASWTAMLLGTRTTLGGTKHVT